MSKLPQFRLFSILADDRKAVPFDVRSKLNRFGQLLKCKADVLSG